MRIIAATLLWAFAVSPTAYAQTLWVSGTEIIGVYDVKAGTELKTFDVPGRTADMHTLPNGRVVLNYRAKAQLVLFDSKSRTEIARLPSSRMGGVNPHHGYILKTASASLYAVLHDGENADTDSSLSLFRIIDAAPGLEYAGEIRLGAGHHKLAHAAGQNWISVSNINDCNNVVQVIDIANAASPRTVRKISASDLGFDGSAPEKTCDATGKAGRRLSPHGAGATPSFHAHNLNGTGHMVVVRANGDAKAIATAGTGGASAVADSQGRLFLTQFTPRDGQGTASACQVGQIAMLDAGGALAGQFPMLRNSNCKEKAQGARLGYVSLAPDGKTLLLPLGTMGNDAAPAPLIARVVIGPDSLQQLASVPVENNIGHRDHAWMEDASLFAFPNNKANSVSLVDGRSGALLKSIPVVPDPSRVAITSE